MVNYSNIHLDLEREQLKKLLLGKTINIKAPKLHTDGEYPLLLTKNQVRKIETAKKKNKGIRLHFTDEQREHHIKNGEGLMDWLRSTYNIVTPFIKPLARPALKKVAEEALKLVPLSQPIKNVSQSLINTGIDELGNKMGFGMKKHKKSSGMGLYAPGYSGGSGLYPAGYTGR